MLEERLQRRRLLWAGLDEAGPEDATEDIVGACARRLAEQVSFAHAAKILAQRRGRSHASTSRRVSSRSAPPFWHVRRKACHRARSKYGARKSRDWSR